MGKLSRILCHRRGIHIADAKGAAGDICIVDIRAMGQMVMEQHRFARGQFHVDWFMVA